MSSRTLPQVHGGEGGGGSTVSGDSSCSSAELGLGIKLSRSLRLGGLDIGGLLERLGLEGFERLLGLDGLDLLGLDGLDLLGLGGRER